MRILVSGCLGKMGRFVIDGAVRSGVHTVVAGVDRVSDPALPFPVFSSFEDCNVDADVIVDFSHPSCLAGLLAYACKNGIPAVLATTGYDDSQIAAIKEAAAKIPVFFSANMSLGVSLLSELTKKAAAVLGDSFDIEIIEKHHNQKLDAPSGTAKMLADAAAEGVSYSPTYVYERQSRRQKREKTEIGISSVRGGNIVGEHEVLFAGQNECITLSHSAFSREVFASGALKAAAFLSGKPAGLYAMKDLIG